MTVTPLQRTILLFARLDEAGVTDDEVYVEVRIHPTAPETFARLRDLLFKVGYVNARTLPGNPLADVPVGEGGAMEFALPEDNPIYQHLAALLWPAPREVPEDDTPPDF